MYGISSAEALNIMAFNPTFSLISCDACFFLLVSYALVEMVKAVTVAPAPKHTHKKWDHEMKCRGKQQLNNYIRCNLLTNHIHITLHDQV